MAGQFYSDYKTSNPIPAQEELLTKLKQQGYESDSNRILTSDLGIPLTFLLLLLGDATQEVNDASEQILDIHVEPQQLRTGDVMSRYSIEAVPQTNAPPDEEWTIRPALDLNSPTISGVTSFTPCEMILPPTTMSTPLTTFFTTNDPAVRIERDWVQSPLDTESTRPAAPLVKSLFLALEMCYAVTERLALEGRSFLAATGIEVDRPRMPATLQASCSRRGSVIHEGSVSLRLSTDRSRIVIDGTPVAELMRTSLEEAEMYAQSIYSSWLGRL